MKLESKDLQLYLITNQNYNNFEKFLEKIKIALDSGVTCLQMREKNISKNEALGLATKLKKIANQKNIPFIINDDVHLAKKVNADGVHIGQNDMSIKEARKILGDESIIGVSVHNLEEAILAQKNGASYIGVGSIFKTNSKKDASFVSIGTLREICNKINLPVVAIGGINSSNISNLYGTGIDGVAVISAILSTDNIKESTEILKSKSNFIYKRNIPAILSIAGSDCSGGAGIQADIKSISACGGFAMSIITSLTAQNTKEVLKISNCDENFLKLQFKSIFTDIYPNSIKIGMLSSKEIIKVVFDQLKKYHSNNIILDPVMVSTSGCKLLDDDAIKLLKKLLIPISSLITPNIFEAEILSGKKIYSSNDMKISCEKIYNDYNCPVLLKGGHSLENANDLFFDGNNYIWFKEKKINNSNTHGTGCTLSSSIATYFALGYTLEESIEKAKNYITKILTSSLDLGHGNGPLDHFFKL